MIFTILSILLGIAAFIIYLQMEVTRKPVTEQERIKFLKTQLKQNLGKEPEEWMIAVTYDFYLMFKEMDPKTIKEIGEWLKEEKRKKLLNKK